MRRRSRLLRAAKRGGVVVCGAIFTACCSSLFISPIYLVDVGLFSIERGALHVIIYEGTASDRRHFVNFSASQGRGFSITSCFNQLSWKSFSSAVGELGLCRPACFSEGPYTFRSGARITQHALFVPLWIPLAIASIPTLGAFAFDRRRLLPGHCPCGYDLTGNVSGTCPECGGEI